MKTRASIGAESKKKEKKITRDESVQFLFPVLFG